MVMCKFYLQGTCRFGNSCKYDHTPIMKDHGFPTTTSVLLRNYETKPQTAQGNPNVDTNTLVKSVINDMVAAEKGGQWLLSSYAPFKEKAAFPGFEDQSMEEIRYLFLEAVKTGSVEQYKQNLQQMFRDAMLKNKALQNPVPEAVNLLVQIYNTKPGNSFQPNFGNAPAGNQSVFGNTSSQSMFGNTNNLAPTNQSMFANSNNAVSSGQSVFGGNTVSNSQSIFGNANSNNTASNTHSVFGNTGVTNNQSIFGNAVNTMPNNQSSVFGNTSNNSSSSIFGGNTQQSNSFGNSSIFGGGTTQQAQNSASPFNGAQQQQASVFAGSAGSQQAFGNSIFGNPQNQQQQQIPPQQQLPQQHHQQNSIFGQQQPPPLIQQQSSLMQQQSPLLQQQSLLVQQQQQVNQPNLSQQQMNIFQQNFKGGFDRGPAIGNVADNQALQHSSSIFGGVNAGNNKNAAAQLTSDLDFYSKIEELDEKDIRWFQSNDLDIANIPEKPPTIEMCH